MSYTSFVCCCPSGVCTKSDFSLRSSLDTSAVKKASKPGGDSSEQPADGSWSHWSPYTKLSFGDVPLLPACGCQRTHQKVHRLYLPPGPRSAPSLKTLLGPVSRVLGKQGPRQLILLSILCTEGIWVQTMSRVPRSWNLPSLRSRGLHHSTSTAGQRWPGANWRTGQCNPESWLSLGVVGTRRDGHGLQWVNAAHVPSEDPSCRRTAGPCSRTPSTPQSP